MTINTNPARANAIGANTRNTPTPVATPFPPRNLSHTGKIWPTITAMAAAVTHQYVFSVRPPNPALAATVEPKIILAIRTAAAPFIASSTSVRTPADFPARRETFVAPVPPDPVSLTSAPLVARTIKYPNGIEPSRYATITISRGVILGLPPGTEGLKGLKESETITTGLKGDKFNFK